MGELTCDCQKGKGIKSKTITDKNLCTSERCSLQVVGAVRQRMKKRLRKELTADPTEQQPEIRELACHSYLDSNLVSSSFICCPVVSSVSSHSNGYYGMVLRSIIFANTPYTLADIFGSISALELLQSSSNGAGSPEHCGAWTSAQSLR
ncbi:uncharacterized protein Dmoj_GI20257, isoform Q [Drosophila mojavensis]|uniref:Uncharacterized protein, isoform Q n=1 Tax=Drosophila mojavensis TaxID=7230 RepID=A0A0Q9XGS3_DROMO|nr:uncharacterized protein Dmoj_GI20257, isoform Q [Drosophila mojavensis]